MRRYQFAEQIAGVSPNAIVVSRRRANLLARDVLRIEPGTEDMSLKVAADYEAASKWRVAAPAFELPPA